MTDPPTLQTELVFEARVTCDSPIVVGDSKLGKRQFIPIVGGEFSGPDIKGRVLPGGGDWQLLRADGVTEIEARYTLQTHDGHNISVVNCGIALYPPKFARLYVRTTPQFEAPNDSAYAWLNRNVFVGTLDVVSNHPLVVRVGVFRVV